MDKKRILEILEAAGIRAAHTMGQVLLTTVGTTATILSDVNWKVVLSSTLLAGLISFTKSLVVGMPEVDYSPKF